MRTFQRILLISLAFMVVSTIRIHETSLPVSKLHEQTTKTPQWGSSQGTPFNWNTKLDGAEVVEVSGRDGWYIDQVKVQTSDGTTSEHSPSFGGNGGGAISWRVPAGEHITDLIVRKGDWLDSVTFVTDAGTHSPTFGGNGGSPITYHIPDGYRLSGVFGSVDGYLKSIGFHLSPANKIQKLPVVGNYNAGQKFEWKWTGADDAQLSRVSGRDGWYIDQIRVFLTNGQSSPAIGGNGGGAYDFSLASGEHVVSALFKSGDWLDSVTFHTSNGRSFKIGGDGGSNEKLVNIPQGSRVVGVYGSTDSYLKSLGLIVAH